MSDKPTQKPTPPPVFQPLYAVTIHHCIAKGELAEMKALVLQAEEHLKTHGNVAASLEALKVEIAKLSK